MKVMRRARRKNQFRFLRCQNQMKPRNEPIASGQVWIWLVRVDWHLSRTDKATHRMVADRSKTTSLKCAVGPNWCHSIRSALTSFNAPTLALSEQLKALAAAFGTKGERRICLTEASKVGRTDSSNRRKQSNRASVSERLGDEQYHRQTITYDHQRRKTQTQPRCR